MDFGKIINLIYLFKATPPITRFRDGGGQFDRRATFGLADHYQFRPHFDSAVLEVLEAIALTFLGHLETDAIVLDLKDQVAITAIQLNGDVIGLGMLADVIQHFLEERGHVAPKFQG